MMPCVSGLGTRLALAFVLSAARPLLTSQPVGRGWFGGVGRILSAQRQLPLQIGDLFFGIRDLLIAFGYLTPEILQLSLQPLILPLQVFPTGLVGLPMALRRCPWLPCATRQSRTHPTYSKQFAAICPAPPLERLPIRRAKIQYNHLHHTGQRVRRWLRANDSIHGKISRAGSARNQVRYRHLPAGSSGWGIWIPGVVLR